MQKTEHLPPGKVRLRDQRKPGHGWFDNEIYDVFGDELGKDGISVYMTLARLCYGVSVRMSIREMAAHARMSKDTFHRNLKKVIDAGLVIERKGSTPQSASAYDLVDVKALALEYVKRGMSNDRASGDQTVSPGDSSDRRSMDVSHSKERMVVSSCDHIEQPRACLTVRQVGDIADKKICLPEIETEVSQIEGLFETEVSQNLRHVRQDTRHKTQDTTPLPPSRGVHADGGPLWRALKTRLKSEIAFNPGLPARGSARFTEIRPGVCDYDHCFRNWWYECLTMRDGYVLFETCADDPEATRLGILKYRTRLERLAREIYALVGGRDVLFEVRETENIKPAA